MRPYVATAVLAALPLSVAAARVDDPAAARTALAATLRAKTEAGAALPADDAYRTALAAYEVLRVTGDASLKSLAEKYPDFGDFLNRFLADRAWTEAYLSAGNVPAGNPHGLETLYRLWQAEGTSKDFAGYRQLSAAIASAFGAGNNAAQLRDGAKSRPFGIDPVWRFRFFRDAWKAGRLDAGFGALKSWELIFVVGKEWDDASYAWLNENINIPRESYTDACWSVRYRGRSDFGDTIQGPLFYAPWRDSMCMAENVKIHGGVCGNLSIFGATAAAAHGIPSYTCGQPGHCAYAVRLARGKWIGGFGGPDGGFHTYVWAGNIHYMETMETVFGDDTGLATALARSWRAHLLADAGDDAGAARELDEALRVSPFHLDLRRERTALLKKSGELTPEKWRAYATSILSAFGDNADPAIGLVAEFDDRFLSDANDATKLDWYANIHAAAARTSASWQWSNQFPERTLARQLTTLRGDDAREALLRTALAAHLRGGALFGKTLEWGVSEFMKQGKADAFGRAFATATAAPGAKIDAKTLRESYDRALLAACEAKSITAFQELGKAASGFGRRSAAPPKLDKPPGKLVSDKGIVTASTLSWCSAVDFYDVLNEKGGLIHSKEETSPAFTVELPQTVTLSGVLVIKTPGNEQRMKHMKILRSVDGATWFPVAETPDMPAQWRADAPDGVTAKWIRVEAVNPSPEFMHFRNILVFAKE